MVDYTLPLEQLPDPLPIEPLTKPFDVTITPPGSKSITCRAYVLAALAEGESKIIRPLRADDTDHLLNALCTLGVEARWVKGETHDGEDVYIKGVGGRFPRGGNLYMGEGGTPTRFMIACACLAAEPVVIDASPRMRERPIAEGVDMLRQLGATIEYLEQEGRLPVRVVPSEAITGGELTIATTKSGQFISAMMLVAPWLKVGIQFRFVAPPTSVAYVELTGRAMWKWGCSFDMPEAWDDAVTEIPLELSISPARIHATVFRIESDSSSALYWFAAGMLTPNSRVTVPLMISPLGQPDHAAILPMAGAGCEMEIDIEGPTSVRSIAGMEGFSQLDCSNFPDAAMALAAIAANGMKRSCLTGLRTLRVKETDRIAALANELRRVGCGVETGEDWIAITPPTKPSSAMPKRAATVRERTDCQSRTTSSKAREGSPLPHGRGSSGHIIIETYNDHRMAMAFAVLGLNPPKGVPLAIRNPKCVAKSYPGFWKDFAKLYQ